MRKFLFVTIFGLIAFASCQAGQNAQENCGICNKPVDWKRMWFPNFAHQSTHAHTECVDSVKLALDSAYAKLNEVFPKDTPFGEAFWNAAQSNFVSVAQCQIGHRTFSDYAKQEGLYKLVDLFDRCAVSEINRLLRKAVLNSLATNSCRAHLNKETCWMCGHKNDKRNRHTDAFQEYYHSQCFNEAMPAFENGLRKLCETFYSYTAECYWLAYSELIRRVQADTAPASIVEYAQKQGSDALQALADLNVQPTIDFVLNEKAKALRNLEKERSQEKERIGKQD